MKFIFVHICLFRCIVLIFGSFFLFSCESQKLIKSSQSNEDIKWLFNGSDLDNWYKTDYAGKGDIRIDDNGSLVLEMGSELSGIHWIGEQLPLQNYEIHLKAKRTLGSDFSVV